MTIELRVSQEKGIFHVPSSVSNDVGIKRTIKRIRPSYKTLPTVINEEDYYRRGIEAKLGVGATIITKFADNHILRPKESENFTTNTLEPVDNLSLAQTLSYMAQEPIEKILVSKSRYQTAKFLKKDVKERISELYNAFLGCRWFECFRQRQVRFSEKRSAPKVKEWQMISRTDLCNWFVGSYDRSRNSDGSIKKLSNNGLVIPRFKEFSTGASNIVNPEALAQLVSLLYGVRFKDVYVQNSEHVDSVVKSFLQRLKTYICTTGINPWKEYSSRKAASLIDRPVSTINYARSRGLFGDATNGILGVDLAAYALKNTQSKIFTASDVNDLFGCNIKFGEFGIIPSERSTISRHRYVFPLYDMIAARAIKDYDSIF